MKKLLRYLKNYLKETIIGPFFKLLEASFELIIPLVVAQIIDIGIKDGDIGYIATRALIMIGRRFLWQNHLQMVGQSAMPRQNMKESA